MKLKQIFCLHLNWRPHYFWHPSDGSISKTWECKRCQKVIVRKPWDPPVNYDE